MKELDFITKELQEMREWVEKHERNDMKMAQEIDTMRATIAKIYKHNAKKRKGGDTE